MKFLIILFVLPAFLLFSNAACLTEEDVELRNFDFVNNLLEQVYGGYKLKDIINQRSYDLLVVNKIDLMIMISFVL